MPCWTLAFQCNSLVLYEISLVLKISWSWKCLGPEWNFQHFVLVLYEMCCRRAWTRLFLVTASSGKPQVVLYTLHLVRGALYTYTYIQWTHYKHTWFGPGRIVQCTYTCRICLHKTHICKTLAGLGKSQVHTWFGPEHIVHMLRNGNYSIQANSIL